MDHISHTITNAAVAIFAALVSIAGIVAIVSAPAFDLFTGIVAIPILIVASVFISYLIHIPIGFSCGLIGALIGAPFKKAYIGLDIGRTVASGIQAGLAVGGVGGLALGAGVGNVRIQGLYKVGIGDVGLPFIVIMLVASSAGGAVVALIVRNSLLRRRLSTPGIRKRR